MKRRSFLASSSEALLPISAEETPSETTTSQGKTVKLIRSTAGIEPYQGPWDTRHAAHLIRRTILGPKVSEIAATANQTLDQLVDTLLSDALTPGPPISYTQGDPYYGATWVNAPYSPTYNNAWTASLKAWWLGLMIRQGISIREKMVLFWHNHFSTEADTVLDARYMYRQNALVRQYALGNFKSLVKAVTIDPAMLIYLNGYRNRGDGNNIPDENYARELQELFTIGKGPEVAPGDYTNYTEQDVKAAAHVLTGWRVIGYFDPQNATIGSYFDPTRHDPKDKVFSSAYQNTVVTGRTGPDGAKEIDDLIDMIFRQQETAKSICRKLYRWFVYYDIDDTIEQNVIAPLADIFRQNNYEIKPVLLALLKSAHFHDDTTIGAQIKNPMEVVAGTIRQLEVALPDPTANPIAYYSTLDSLRRTGAALQQDLLDPPNVAGWPAYYQTPQFSELWINTATFPGRNTFTNNVINGFRSGGVTTIVDPITYAKLSSNPNDVNVLINDIVHHLFAIELTDNQKTILKNVLLPGLPDYEWAIEWSTYMSNPTETNRKTVASRLSALLKFMMAMPEYQLA